jgi:ribosomal-protein-alanine N-acetyltransferase
MASESSTPLTSRLEQIITPRLRLRRARMSDLPAIHAIFQQPETLTYWSHGPHTNIDQSRYWLTSMVDESDKGLSDEFVIELLPEGRIIPNGPPAPVSQDGRVVVGKFGVWSMPEIGFFIHSSYTRQGIFSEVISAFLDYVWGTHPDLKALTADVDPRNTACLEALAKFGFVETRREINSIVTHMGPCDSVWLELKRPELAPAFFPVSGRLFLASVHWPHANLHNTQNNTP